jgi:Na+-driven multidrug efflux pump
MADSETLQTSQSPHAPAPALESIASESSAAPTGSTSFWGAIRESLRGSRQDYTVGPIGRSIILLAIPMVLEMCMESIFAVVDIKWVSYLGPDAMATVGLTESMLTLMYAIAIGLSIGATATVARRIGEHNPNGAARAAVQSLALGLIVSTVIALVGAPLTPKLLSIMGASPEVVAHGWGFTTIMLAGNLTIMMLFMINFLGSIGVIFVVFARQIVGLFTDNAAVVPYGVDCLRIVACGFVFYAYGMVLTQSFNGAGDTWTPTILNLFVFWLWELPLAYVLAIVFGFGPRGVFLAIMIAFSTLAIVSALFFRRGRWKMKVV